MGISKARQVHIPMVIISDMVQQQSNPNLSDWDLKVRRAKHHLVELNDVLNSYRNGNSFEVQLEQKPGEWIWKLITNTPPPADLSLIVGDIVHNLRSALDCRVVAVAKQFTNHELTDDEERLLDFPIFDSEREFNKHIKKWKKLPSNVRDAVTKCVVVFQRGGKPSQYWTDSFTNDESSVAQQHVVTFDGLARLTWLSNRDKHRRLHTVFLAPSEGSHSGFPDGTQFDWNRGWLKNGDRVATLTALSSTDLGEARAEIQVVPVLEGAIQRGDYSLYEELRDLSHIVKNALKIFNYEVEHLV